jgi:hypothetical protein
MADLVTDPDDPRLGHGADAGPTPQQQAYLILSEAQRKRGFVRPVRQSYQHTVCGTVTRMSLPLAETYARDPKFYGATYCVGCRRHVPVSECVWDGTSEVVGS